MSEQSESKSPNVASAVPRTRRTVMLVVVAVAVVVGGVWGVRRWSYARAHVSTDNAQVDGRIVPVIAKVGGYVREVAVDDNQSVTKGDTVVVIDDAELQVKLAEAEADLAAALAAAGSDGQPGQVEADASATRARRQAVESRLASARAHADKAAKDLVRVQELAAKQIASSQQLDAAQAAATAAQADVQALESEIAAARASEQSAGAAGRAADARLAHARAALQQAQLDLSYAHITAPVTGTMSRSQVEVGQLVQAGQPLGALVSDSAVWVTANLKETETSDVHDGQPVELDVDAYPGCTAHGEVESMSPATGSKFALLPPDNATGNFTKVVQRVPVRVAITEGCGEDRPLRPGMSVVAHIAVH